MSAALSRTRSGSGNGIANSATETSTSSHHRRTVDVDVDVDQTTTNAKGGEGEDGGSPTSEEILETMNTDIFLKADDRKCIYATIEFFGMNSKIKDGCSKYSDSYTETEVISTEAWDEESKTYISSDVIELGYPLEALQALEVLCNDNNGYWMVTTEKIEFTCIAMELETVQVNVNNYGECLANINACQQMDINLLMESMFATMDYACYTGDTRPENFDIIEDKVDNEYFEEFLDEEGIVLTEGRGIFK